MNAAATIITNDYIHYALTLRESLISFNENIKYFILVTKQDVKLKEKIEKKYSGTVVLFCDELCKDGIEKKIYDKYYINHKDEFRWSMKPILLKYLIENLNFDKALYLDCDLFFFGSYDFLFEKLETSRLILTPHWRSTDPHNDPWNFQVLFTNGIYNAGFVGINRDAIEIVNWWAMACEYLCVKQPEKGYFNDQAYLNILPIKFDKVEIIKHRGCNVANWNQLECRRIISENGEVLINDQYPVIFIHFTEGTIKGILTGEDNLLRSHLEKYSDALKKYNPSFDLISEYTQIIANPSKVNSNNSLIKKLKRLFYGVK